MSRLATSARRASSGHSRRRSPRAGCSGWARSTSAGSTISAATGADSGRSGFSWSCSSARCSPNSSPTTGRYRLLQGRDPVPDLHGLSRREVRRLPRDDRLSRSVHRRRDRRAWLDALAADPLFLSHHRARLADAGAVAADVDAHQRAMRGRGGAHTCAWQAEPWLRRYRMELAWHGRSGS